MGIVIGIVEKGEISRMRFLESCSSRFHLVHTQVCRSVGSSPGRDMCPKASTQPLLRSPGMGIPSRRCPNVCERTKYCTPGVKGKVHVW